MFFSVKDVGTVKGFDAEVDDAKAETAMGQRHRRAAGVFMLLLIFCRCCLCARVLFSMPMQV